MDQAVTTCPTHDAASAGDRHASFLAARDP
jgi:hypothetical protein